MRTTLEESLPTDASPYTDGKALNKSSSLGAAQHQTTNDQHGRQPSHDRFSSNFDYQLNYQK